MSQLSELGQAVESSLDLKLHNCIAYAPLCMPQVVLSSAGKGKPRQKKFELKRFSLAVEENLIARPPIVFGSQNALKKPLYYRFSNSVFDRSTAAPWAVFLCLQQRRTRMPSANVVKLFTAENPSALADRGELTEAIALLARLCSSKQPIQILNHIRVSSEPGGLAFAATNLDIQAETSVSADADARFSAALPAAALLRLMKKGTPSPTAILELLADDANPDADHFVLAKCAIQLASTRFVLDALPTEDFPAPIGHQEGATVQRFSIASAVLWNAIDGTLDAASTDETRYYLNGVYIHSLNGRLRFASTDGHRLYIQDTNVQTGKSEISAILPTVGARFVALLIDGHASADLVKVEISETIAVFTYRDVAVTVKLVDGTYPDYQRVIPAQPDRTATITGSTLSAAVASLVDCTGATSVRLAFHSDALLITASGTVGEGSTELECAFDGEELEIAFDARYLRSAIEAASPDGRNMKFRMVDAVSPAIVSGSIGGWTGVLMPSRS